MTPGDALEFQGETGLLLRDNGNIGIPFPMKQGNRLSSRVEVRTSGFLSSSDVDFGVPMEFQQGTQASSSVETWNSASLSRF